MQMKSSKPVRTVADGSGQLRDYLAALLGDDGRLIVASNRGPLSFSQTRSGEWHAKRGSGGLVTALGELGRLAPVTWVSAAMDRDDRIAAELLKGPPSDTQADILRAIAHELPGQDIRLDLRPVAEEAWRSHYTQFANPFLWFMQHQLFTLHYEPTVDDALINAWRRGYSVINDTLAQAVLRQTYTTQRRPVVLLQDYHLYLAAGEIRAERPDALLLHFNHIPWPSVDSWMMLPQGLRRGICEGLLGNDIVGLQTDRYATNFLSSVAAFVRDAEVDPDGRHVRWRGRTIWVRAYPISIEPDSLAAFARSPAVERRRAELHARLERAGSPRLIVRVDRLEPSKNALRGFIAFENLLKRRPELRASVRFLAIQSVSRADIADYAQYAAAVREVVARVNGLADPDEAPIWLLDGSDYDLAIAALSLADVVLVNPVVDGMNLVAKEAAIVSRAALVLSETAGAAEQLASDALMVSAADVSGTAAMLERGLDMPLGERLVRIRRLRASVREEDLQWWLTRQLRDLAAWSHGRRPPSRALRDTTREFEPALHG
jgi:trehalose 6-phosphate synthase